MASDERVWQAVAKQMGLVHTDTLDQFVDACWRSRCCLRAPTTDGKCRHVRHGGGASVMATDVFASVGLSVPAFTEATLRSLEDLNLPPGSCVSNPIDTPRSTLRVAGAGVVEKILEAVYASGSPDALVMHLNIASFVGSADQRFNILENLIQTALGVQSRAAGRTHFALVLRSDGSVQADERKRADRARAVALGIPVFDEIPESANALAAVSRYEHFLATRGAETLQR